MAKPCRTHRRNMREWREQRKTIKRLRDQGHDDRQVYEQCLAFCRRPRRVYLPRQVRRQRKERERGGTER